MTKQMQRQAKARQRRVIRELTTSLRNCMLSKIDRVPSNWNGIEIRRWATDLTMEGTPVKMESDRRRHYENDRVNFNL